MHAQKYILAEEQAMSQCQVEGKSVSKKKKTQEGDNSQPRNEKDAHPQ